jgi:hypothetical protein
VFCDLAVTLADSGRCVSEARQSLAGCVARAPRRVGGRGARGRDPRLEATPITAHSEKEFAAGPYKGGFGFHPLLATCDREVLAAILRPRSFKLACDSTAPATGTFGYTSGYFKTASARVTFTKGTDGGSGLNTTSGEEAAH